ncbi:MAG: ABC transporter permease, partial [Blastocatellia bacterium]
RVIGRLKPGANLQQAQAQMATIADRLGSKYPETNAHFGVHLTLEFQNLVGDVRPSLILLFIAVGCVLLIACANVANLLLARATSRQKEIAIRSALGAGRARVVRQLLTESILLSLTGAAVGILASVWGIGLLMNLAPKNLPRLQDVGINWTVLGFTVLVALVTGILFGLAPALQLSRGELSDSLKEGGRESSDASHGKRLGGLLVIGEVAVATVLLLVAGLLLKSFNNLRQVNPGFNPNNLLTAVVDLPRARYSQQQRVQFERDLLSRAATVPGVKSVSEVFPAPLSGDSLTVGLEIEGRTDPPGQLPEGRVTVITPDYFQTMNIHLEAGRPFSARDDDESDQVVIVNRTLAEKYFSLQNAIGKRIGPTISSGPDTPMREIVGVVDDVKYSSITESASPAVYLPHSQLPFNPMEIVLRTEGDPRSAVGGLKQSISELDKNLPIFAVRTMDEYLGSSVSTQRFSAVLLSIFAGVALVLALIGLYGVLAYTVAQRTHEFGLRMALGADRSNILRTVLIRGMSLVGFGLAIGLGGAFAASRLISGMLYGVRANDPVTFGLVAASFVVVGAIACIAPALKATRVDPMVALRYE